MKKILINEVCVFFVETSALAKVTNINNCVDLDPLESAVLTMLVEKEGELVAYSTLLSLWRSAHITDGALNRVISSIRKKLKHAGIDSNVIVNKSKRGYILKASLATFTDNSPRAFFIEHGKQKRRQLGTQAGHQAIENMHQWIENPRIFKRVLQFFGSVSVSLIISFITFHYFKDGDFDRYEMEVSTIYKSADLKLELSENPALEYISYATKAFDDPYYKVHVLNNVDNSKIVIEEKGMNVSKAVWLSDNELIARVYGADVCKVIKYTFDFNEKSYSSRTIFACNPNSRASAIARFGDQHILMTDAHANNVASDLFLGNLDTGKIETIGPENQGGAGYYNVITNPSSPFVVLLSSSDAVQFTIELVDPRTEWEVVWRENTTAINISVGWDGDVLSFKNSKNGISVVQFNNGVEKNRNHIPMFLPFNNVTTTESGILLTTGEMFPTKLLHKRFDSDIPIDITAFSPGKNQHPVFYSESSIYYISNASGMPQLWMFDLYTQTGKQVSVFKDNKRIRHFAIDAESNLVAVEDVDGIHIYEILADATLSGAIHSFGGQHPEFYNQALVFTEYVDNEVSLKAIDIGSFEVLDWSISNASDAKRSDKALYYKKSYPPSIWKFSPNDEDQVLVETSQHIRDWSPINKLIYYSTIGGTTKRYDTEAQSTELIENECKLASAWREDACIFRRSITKAHSLVKIAW